MKLKDEVKNFDKERLFDTYTRIVSDFKDYDKITKSKMLDEIFEVYSDYHNIIDICTVRELEYLKLVLENNEEIYNEQKYRWEISQLARKHLIFRLPKINIPEEVYDFVCLAIKNIDWSLVRENTRINEVLIGLCKVYGELQADVLVQLGSALLKVDTDRLIKHVSSNKLFLYYVYFDVKNIPNFNKEIPIFIYQEYFDVLDELDEERKKQGIAYSGEIDIEDYVNIFYYDLNINRKKVNLFYKKLKETTPLYFFLIERIRTYSLLNIDRGPLKEYLGRFLHVDEKEQGRIYRLLDQAMDEMPSGALNGATPNDVKLIRLERERNRYQREVDYLSQQNAKLTKKEVSTFYKIYFALLEFTNKKYHINTKVKKIYKQQKINPNDIIDIVDKFWSDKEIIIHEFIDLNPYKFKQDELDLVKEMVNGIRDIFVIARYDKEYTMMLSNNKIYMVKGLNGNIDRIISYQDLPVVVRTSLLPFNGKITYDGMFQSMPNIDFGVQLERMVESELGSSSKVYHL